MCYILLRFMMCLCKLCILCNMSRTISKCITSSVLLTTSLMVSLCSLSFAKCKLRLRPSHTCSLPIVSDVSSVEKTSKFRERIHPWSISSLMKSTDVVSNLYQGNLLLQFQNIKSAFIVIVFLINLASVVMIDNSQEFVMVVIFYNFHGIF